MKNWWLTYFEGRAAFYNKIDELPTNITQTIHTSESRVNALLSMTSTELKTEYPGILSLLQRKEEEKEMNNLDDLDDIDDMNSLDLYNEE